ncbi:hypothetical protein AVEN_146872-1 [Araneus ventricosus]|uniref:Uncharacterized protein n=1 Tax=Araneus ventricosus TaxID=182803 RepID=A0A4Y2Q9D3_ARAVE|nr:hypothetical protein AVEN_146872-1 [Araneus ventricosus]
MHQPIPIPIHHKPAVSAINLKSFRSDKYNNRYIDFLGIPMKIPITIVSHDSHDSKGLLATQQKNPSYLMQSSKMTKSAWREMIRDLDA